MRGDKNKFKYLLIFLYLLIRGWFNRLTPLIIYKFRLIYHQSRGFKLISHLFKCIYNMLERIIHSYKSRLVIYILRWVYKQVFILLFPLYIQLCEILLRYNLTSKHLSKFFKRFRIEIQRMHASETQFRKFRKMFIIICCIGSIPYIIHFFHGFLEYMFVVLFSNVYEDIALLDVPRRIHDMCRFVTIILVIKFYVDFLTPVLTRTFLEDDTPYVEENDNDPNNKPGIIEFIRRLFSKKKKKKDGNRKGKGNNDNDKVDT